MPFVYTEVLPSSGDVAGDVMNARISSNDRGLDSSAAMNSIKTGFLAIKIACEALFFNTFSVVRMHSHPFRVHVKGSSQNYIATDKINPMLPTI